MTIVAPYCYSWSRSNSVYQIKTLMDARNKAKVSYVTLAFAIADARGNITSDIYNCYDDIKQFQTSGGKVILSFGGAAGPYLTSVMSADQEYNVMYKLLQDTGIRMIDYDVEGAYIAMQSQNDQRSKVLARLQQAIPGLYVSFTLAVEAPSQWSKGGLPANAIDMLKNAIANGVNVNVVNMMTMDYYTSLPAGKSWGQIACDISESVKTQLQSLYPSKSEIDLYKMIGITPMIGRNDDNTVFALSDAKIVATYAQQKGIGLLAFWAIQRDQVGTGELAVYSQVNKNNFEFTNVFLSVQSQQPQPQPSLLQPQPKPQPTPSSKSKPTPSHPQPTPIFSAWQENVSYKIGDIVSYNGSNYKCIQAHTSIVTWAPGIYTQALWKLN